MKSLDEFPSPSHLNVTKNSEQLLADNPDEIETFLRQLNYLDNTGPQTLVSREIGVLAPLLSIQCLLQIQRAFTDWRTWRQRELDPDIGSNRSETVGEVRLHLVIAEMHARCIIRNPRASRN